MLAAALSTFLILSVPGYALQVAVSRAVAARRLGASGELGATMRRWTLRLGLATLALALAGALFRGPLAELLNVDAPWAAAATLPTVTLWVLLCVNRGVLAGLGRYRVVGLSIAGEAVGRLVLGLGLVLAGLGTTGAYLGTPLAMALAALVLARVLARARAEDEAAAAAVRLRDVLRDAVVPIAALALIAVLQNVDVIVVRHQVAEVQAGAYAAAAVAAKVVVWTAVGVALYVIPEAAGRTAAGRGARPVLLRASAVVATVAAPALLVMALAPELVLRLGFGPSYEIAADALPLLAVAMSVLALTYLTVNYLLAVGSSRFLAPLAVVALAEPVLLLSGSLDSLTSFATVVLLVQLAAAGAVVVPTLRRVSGGGPGPGMIARLVVVAAAVAAIVVLAGQLRTARDVDRAAALIQAGRAPDRVDDALSLLRGAAARTADTTPLVRAAELQLFAGNHREALAEAQAAARREPENARAWLVAAQAAAQLGDEPLEAAARRRLSELVAVALNRRRVASSSGSGRGTRRSARRGRLVGLGQRDQEAREQDRRQRRARRHLPVPVERAVRAPDRERGHRARHGSRREPAGTRRAGRDAAEERGEQEQPHQAELGRRLELERVGVAHHLRDRALAQPERAERAGPMAAQRGVREALQRDPPVRVAVGVGAAETCRRRPRAGALRPALDRGRAGHERHRDDEPRHDRRRAHPAQPLGRPRRGEPARRRGCGRRERAGARASSAAPCDSRRPSGPATSCTAGSSAASRPASAAAAATSSAARSCTPPGAIASSTASPTIAATIAPRENDSARPAPSGAAAAAASARMPRGRTGSPARRAHSTIPIAASAPIAFQYVSGCSSRPIAVREPSRSIRPGSTRSASP